MADPGDGPGEKKKNIQTSDTYEDCNYIEDDSRRQNKMQRILKGKLRPIYVSFFFYFTTYFPNLSYVNSKRPSMEGCSNELEKESKAGGRKKRRGQLETVKMGEEKGQRMEGRERGMKQFHVNFWFDVAKR